MCLYIRLLCRADENFHEYGNSWYLLGMAYLTVYSQIVSSMLIFCIYIQYDPSKVILKQMFLTNLKLKIDNLMNRNEYIRCIDSNIYALMWCSKWPHCWSLHTALLIFLWAQPFFSLLPHLCWLRSHSRALYLLDWWLL